MNAIIWIVQILLALAFIGAGIMKVTQPIDKLGERMKWVYDIQPSSLVRVIGALEILGALGIILPALTGILPWLTPIAAGGLVLTMVGAFLLSVTHGRYGEAAANLVLLALAAFIIYGRLVAVPLA